MKKTPLSKYDYDLPASLIAQRPSERRSESRLLHLHRQDNTLSHHHFSDIATQLQPGDVLVINESKVINARLYAQRKSGANIEIFLLEEYAPEQWVVLLKNAQRVKIDETLHIADDFSATLRQRIPESGHAIVQFSTSMNFWDALDTYGHLPLPPYIKDQNTLSDVQDRYQTVFAKHHGAVAAPTAGLHFTDELMEKLKKLNITILPITLHVGYGTFKPVECDYIEDHIMHKERYIISDDTAKKLNHYKENGNRIIAVGTTAVRTLEAAYQGQKIQSGSNETDIFIRPGYTFKIVDGLITNFHLPKSTLLCLVSALAGEEQIKIAYQTAIEEKYRFYSFGDAMLIL